MKIRNILCILTWILTSLSALTSCGVDRWPEYAAETELDQWITQVMRENYLWYTEIPNDNKLNFFTAPQTFFNSILSKEDNKVSYIDTIVKEPLPSYGFDYALYRVANNDTAYNALVTYVLPKSSASKAGIQRGDWIMQVNDSVITSKNEKALLGTSLPLHLQLGRYTVQIDPETEEEVGIVVESRTTDMAAASRIWDNPVHYSTVLTTSSGLKVGYIVYSHFSAGTATDPELYNDQLRTISKEFASKGVSQLILDLRYNRGGSLACAQLLTTLIAPQTALGTPMGRLAFNDKQSSKDSTFTFDLRSIQSGENMDISQGIILSSNATGGVSGVMLNLLFPLKRWGLIGSNVACSGIATERFDNEAGTWSINPAVCTVFNSEDESGQGGSFTATQAISETTDLTKFLPFGDVNEALLSAAMNLLDGTRTVQQQSRANIRTVITPVKEVIYTPSRKAEYRTKL